MYAFESNISSIDIDGNFHSEHGLADKWYPHEESIRVPLIIHDPRMAESVKGTTNDEFTLNIDLAPTILRAAGIPVPDKMQGRDMSELYLSPDGTDWRKEFFYEHPIVSSKHYVPASEALVRKVSYIRILGNVIPKTDSARLTYGLSFIPCAIIAGLQIHVLAKLQL